VRELANLLERLAILFPDKTVTAQDLPERYRASGEGALFSPLMRMPSPPDALSEAAVDSLLDDPSELELERIELVTAEAPAAIDGQYVGSALKSGGIDLKDHLSSIEIDLIRKALIEAHGTVAEAARLLKIRRTTLVEKLRKYRLTA
jgi:sigma-54 specific flagellar transcriptional regulator A